jgi:hypothetical protein
VEWAVGGGPVGEGPHKFSEFQIPQL